MKNTAIFALFVFALFGGVFVYEARATDFERFCIRTNETNCTITDEFGNSTTIQYGDILVYQGVYPDTSTLLDDGVNGTWNAGSINDPLINELNWWLFRRDVYPASPDDAYIQFPVAEYIENTATTTQIFTTIPTNGSTIATTSASVFGASGYIESDDWVTGTVLDVRIAKDETAFASVGASANPCLIGVTGLFCVLEADNLINENFTIPITASGNFALTNSRTLTSEGRYTITAKIIKPLFTLGGVNVGQVTLATKTMSFVAGAKNTYDDFVDNIASTTTSYIQNFDSDSCSVVSGSFNLGECFIGLLIPSGNVFSAYTRIPDLLAEKFPFSYINSMGETWTGLVASSTENAPNLEFELQGLGIGSTTPLGNILPNVTVFSTTTMTQYFPEETFDLLKNLASFALIIGLFTHIFFSVRNLFKL